FTSAASASTKIQEPVPADPGRIRVDASGVPFRCGIDRAPELLPCAQWPCGSAPARMRTTTSAAATAAQRSIERKSIPERAMLAGGLAAASGRGRDGRSFRGFSDNRNFHRDRRMRYDIFLFALPFAILYRKSS